MKSKAFYSIVIAAQVLLLTAAGIILCMTVAYERMNPIDVSQVQDMNEGKQSREAADDIRGSVPALADAAAGEPADDEGENTGNKPRDDAAFVSQAFHIDAPATVLAFGDMMLGRYVDTLVGRNGPDWLFSGIVDQNGRMPLPGDIVMANLEGPVTDYRAPSQKAISFRFDKKNVELAKKAGFNTFGLANNHGMDQGQTGLDDTRESLQDLSVDFFGDPRSEERHFVLIKQVSGKKIALVGLNQIGHKITDRVLEDTMRFAREHSDFMIVTDHWGQEYKRNWNSRQQARAEQLVDLGADAVIGHHPHVVQGLEIVNGKPVFYSLGNFIFDQYFSKATQEGLAVALEIRDQDLRITLYPLKSERSRPRLMDESEKTAFFEEFISLSELDEPISQSIRQSGEFTLAR